MEMGREPQIKGGRERNFYHLSRYEFRHLIFYMKAFAACQGLEILAGKVYIFIAEMTGGQGVSLMPSHWF